MISFERQITALSLTSLCTLALPCHTTDLPNQMLKYKFSIRQREAEEESIGLW